MQEGNEDGAFVSMPPHFMSLKQPMTVMSERGGVRRGDGFRLGTKLFLSTLIPSAQLHLSRMAEYLLFQQGPWTWSQTDPGVCITALTFTN